jgi:hypothetical protein
MDLTAAFEELLKRKGRREGYQYRQSILYSAHSPASSWRLSCLKELTATMGQIKAASPLLPSIPICNWIVPTLHILLGIINDIVSRYGAFMAEHLEVDTERCKSLQLAQDEKHYALQLAQEKKEKLISSAEEQYKKVRAEHGVQAAED